MKDEFLPGDVARRRPDRRARAPAPTAAAWPASTTTCRGRRWSPSGTARRGVIVRRETTRTCSASTSTDDRPTGRRRTSGAAAYGPDGGTTAVQHVDTGQDESVFPGAGPGGGASVSESDKRPLRVALLGCGVVGTDVARLLTEHAADLAARVGAPLEIVGIAVRRPGKDRSATGVDPALFTTDAEELVTRADVVVEVIGGIEPARSLILRALEPAPAWSPPTRRCWPRTARRSTRRPPSHGVDLYFEAAVAGAIPLLRPLRESLAGDRRHAGCSASSTAPPTSSSTRWTPPAPASPRRSSEARRSATPRPTRPPTSRASTPRPRPRSWPGWPSTPGSGGRRLPRGHHRGHRRRRRRGARDGLRRQAARHLRAHVARQARTTASSVRVHPAMIPRTHPLAGVREAFNAVFVEAEAAGQLMFYGPGAGGDADRVAPCSATSSRWPGTGSPAAAARASRPTPTCRSLPMGEALTRYHVSLDVADRPGVLAAGRAGASPSTACRSRRCASSCRADGGTPATARQPGRRHPHGHRRGAVGDGGRPRGAADRARRHVASCASKEE